MSYSQFFLIISVFILSFIVLDGLLGIWIKDDERKEMDAWQESQRTLGQLGGSEPGLSSNGLNAHTGVRNVGVRRPTRTLRGDCTRLWERCRRITKTRF